MISSFLSFSHSNRVSLGIKEIKIRKCISRAAKITLSYPASLIKCLLMKLLLQLENNSQRIHGTCVCQHESNIKCYERNHFAYIVAIAHFVRFFFFISLQKVWNARIHRAHTIHISFLIQWMEGKPYEVSFVMRLTMSQICNRKNL